MCKNICFVYRVSHEKPDFCIYRLLVSTNPAYWVCFLLDILSTKYTYYVSLFMLDIKYEIIRNLKKDRKYVLEDVKRVM